MIIKCPPPYPKRGYGLHHFDKSAVKKNQQINIHACEGQPIYMCPCLNAHCTTSENYKAYNCMQADQRCGIEDMEFACTPRHAPLAFLLRSTRVSYTISMQSRRNRNAAPNQYSNQKNTLTEEGAGSILLYSRGGLPLAIPPPASFQPVENTYETQNT